MQHLKERNLLRWGLLLVSNKFIKNPKKLKELKRVIEMNNENIYTDLHNHLQAEKEECRQEGERTGEIKGKQKRNIEIASTMIDKGYSPNEIVEITQLDINSIEELKLAR